LSNGSTKTDQQKFAVFTTEQLKMAALEIAMRVHDYDETAWNIDEEEVWKILCKWTKEVPPKQPVWNSTERKIVSFGGK
jgi:hypothetical protein